MLVENTPTQVNKAENEIVIPWSVREVLFALIAVIFLSVGMI